MSKAVNGFLVLFTVIFLFACSKTMSEKEYYDLASRYMTEENWEKAEENFKQILRQYPNGVFSSKAMFMVGFINANHLNDYEEAQKFYSHFLEKFPNHDLADDAQYELQNLGKNLDDLPFLKGEAENNEENAVGQASSTAN